MSANAIIQQKPFVISWIHRNHRHSLHLPSHYYHHSRCSSWKTVFYSCSSQQQPSVLIVFLSSAMLSISILCSCSSSSWRLSYVPSKQHRVIFPGQNLFILWFQTLTASPMLKNISSLPLFWTLPLNDSSMIIFSLITITLNLHRFEMATVSNHFGAIGEMACFRMWLDNVRWLRWLRRKVSVYFKIRI